MNGVDRLFWSITAAVVLAAPGASFAVKSAEKNFSGINDYKFDPNPQEITPKLYNWEIKLNRTDSRNGAYEIVQITSTKGTEPGGAPSTSTVLISSELISPNEEGIIDFKLYVGDEQPTQNMGRRGDIGEPIIFSGIGTAKAQSGWIVLPGAKVRQVSPSTMGTRLSEGSLNLIQFIGSNDRGDQYKANVILRRK